MKYQLTNLDENTHVEIQRGEAINRLIDAGILTITAGTLIHNLPCGIGIYIKPNMIIERIA